MVIRLLPPKANCHLLAWFSVALDFGKLSRFEFDIFAQDKLSRPSPAHQVVNRRKCVEEFEYIKNCNPDIH